MKTFSILIILLNFSSLDQKVFAHAPREAESSRASCPGADAFCRSANISNNNGINIMNAGFGYFGHPNDEELNSFEFGCSSGQRRQYVNEFCGGPRSAGSGWDSTPIMLQLVRPMFEGKVRKAFFEKMKLEADVTNSTLPEVPSCLKTETDDSDPITREEVIERRREQQRYNTRKARTKEQFSIPAIVRSLYSTDRIERFLKKDCKNNRQSSNCVSARNILERIKMNFPMLFPPAAYINGVSTPDPGAPYRNRIRNALYQSIGSFEKRSASVADQISAGEKFYQANLKEAEISGGIAFDKKLIAMSAVVATNPALKRAEELLDRRVTLANQQYIKASKERFHKCSYGMGLICTPGPAPENICESSVIHAAMSNYPNVIRQALAEMNAQEREGAKLLMCRWNLLQSYRRYRCQGVTTNQASPRTVQVRRQQHSYPYQSSVGYTLIEGQPENFIPHIIKSKIYVRNKTRKSAGEFKTEMDAKARTVSEWYTRQTTARNIEVQVEFVPTSNEDLEPSFNIHNCYRAEINSSDCRKVREYYCLKEECSDNTTCAEACMRREGDDPAIFNRENASNLAVNTSDGTRNHEVGHLLGLDDEYQDDGVRYTDLSRDDRGGPRSIMQSSSTGVLRTRHINQIMAPLQCADQD